MSKKERFCEAFYFLKREGIFRTQIQAAQAMDASPSNISSALAGNERVLTDNFLLRFASAFKQISLEWLLHGTGNMLTMEVEFKSENQPQVLLSDEDKDVIEEQKKMTERVMELVNDFGHTPKTFGLKADIEISLFQRKLKGQSVWSVADVHKICDTFKVRKSWLVDGQGQKFRVPEEVLETIPARPSKYTESEIEELIESTETKPHIPTEVFAGGMTGISDAVTQEMCEMKPVVRMLPAYDYTITIKGDSMEPKYESGDIIAIKKVFDVIEWGGVYILDTNDGAVLKRLYDDGDRFRCVSYNPEYPDFYVDKSLVLGVYRVVGVIRI